ncbi:MAG: radical SAM protein [Candidatus Sumerlaeia bacterium]
MLHGWNYLTPQEEKLIRDGIRDGSVYGGPFHVELGPTESCNYHCFFCNAAYVDRSQRIPWDRMSRLLDELHGMGMKSLRLAGNGEPLTYPEIKQLLDFCIDRGIRITNLTTNGYLLTKSIAERLLTAGTDEVIVSFNDVTAEKYARTNGTTERAFEVVQENIKHLIAERNRRRLPGPRLIQQFFVWKGNHAEIERAYELGLACGADHVYLRDMSGLEPKDRMSEAELAEAGRAIERVRERDRKAGKLLLGFSHEEIPVGPAAADAGDGPKSRTEYCYIGWYSALIRGNGDIVPCCMLSGDQEMKPLANLHDFGSFRQIWEGPAYRQLRDELRDIALGRGDYQAVRRPCRTRPWCAARYACPFIHNLAGAGFYEKTDAEMEALRPKKSALSRLFRRFLIKNNS